MFRNMLPRGAAPKPRGPFNSASLTFMAYPRQCSEALACPTLVRKSKFHHGPADDFPGSQQLDMLVELVELEELDGVADLVLSRQRHDLGQVGVVSPVRSVEGLLARNPGEQRDVDAVADQADIGI